MKTKNPYYKDEQKYFLNTFKRQPWLLVKAKDSTVWDKNGKRYIDFFSGLAVCGVGHNHPAIVGAIKKQADKLLHSSNFFYTQPQMDLAKAITARYKGSQSYSSPTRAPKRMRWRSNRRGCVAAVSQLAQSRARHHHV